MSKTLCERLKEAVSAVLDSKRTQDMIAQIKLGRLSSEATDYLGADRLAETTNRPETTCLKHPRTKSRNSGSIVSKNVLPAR